MNEGQAIAIRPATESLLDADIEVLRLSLRTTNVLRLNELHTVRDLTRVPAKKLFVLSRLGRNSLREIVESVHRRGLRLAE
ncbi:DNA-directed RNA polymerase subunit alpha [Variovorax sp. PBS-H4]|uniref:DNA-directed RNA polymerase subunit alpha C-terminal domain-containing protein n=1 Tax=Variovorax sp. PBS-H4 TaxID=434008 RepID=UPI001318C765|nr:DNA-directed RNA polymerase subunit alpha C-terminal domain-containing protein [Variovorax sp. PBS-H4]VTU18527.1 DNA-directed RNA polymerase subunit alpha [Variovorax sp. PBS-H4]